MPTSFHDKVKILIVGKKKKKTLNKWLHTLTKKQTSLFSEDDMNLAL